jgi:putative ATPase
MPPVSFYQPTERGLEAKIAEKLARLRELDAQAGKLDAAAKNKKG